MVPRETALRPEYAVCAAIRCASVTAGMTFCSTVELIIRCASVTTGMTFCSTVEVNCGSTTLGGGNFVFAPLLAYGRERVHRPVSLPGDLCLCAMTSHGGE